MPVRLAATLFAGSIIAFTMGVLDAPGWAGVGIATIGALVVWMRPEPWTVR